MTEDWTPIFVLPNIIVTKAIGCEIAQLAPADDIRIKRLRATHPNLGNFLCHFTDNFGVAFEPSVLLVRTDQLAVFSKIEALASFRDLIAIATITRSRALELRHPRGLRTMYGDSFAIYPWMLDRHYNDMIGSTPAILGTHEVARFRGQSSPAVFRTQLDNDDFDQPLLAALMERWRRSYETSKPIWEDIALMRSLNMAFQASLMPGGVDTTFYDIGRIVSLWVSAFEILVHPGGSGQANRDKVFKLIEQTLWETKPIKELNYDTGGRTKTKRTLASHLYQVLYECRNAFLHGNPVEPADLVVETSERSIFVYAAPLYRIALTSFLPLVLKAEMPSTDNFEAQAAYLNERSSFRDPQRDVEEALLTATKKPIP
jgi:hypothetical protein